MVRILEHSRGYYECREVLYGNEYVWHPELLVLECDCGEKALSMGFLADARCACGVDLAASVRGKLGAHQVEEEQMDRPWRRSYRAWSNARRNHREYDVWQEWKALDEE